MNDAPGSRGGGSSGSNGGTSGAGGASGASGSGALEPAAELPAPSTRAYRLTHAQWQRTVRDLLQLPASTMLPGQLRDDPVQSGSVFDNNALSLVVDEALFSGYERAASELAALVAGDATLLGKLAPAGTLAADVRADTFVRDFGLRAHRRPLDATAIAEYRALFDLGPTLYTGLGAFEAGARALIEAMLLSPYFLYRIEESTEEVDGVVPLDGYEVASRLSYALWGSMPDGALLDAAGAGELDDAAQVATHAARMLGDDRAREVIVDFHGQLFDVERFATIKPSAAFFPDAPATLAESAAAELERFVVDQVLDRESSYADLLLSTDTFANEDLAPIYGLSGSFGPELVPVQLDPAERSGFLTQIGFLASHATSVNPDPIHRGVFVARRIACTHISAPPANIPPLPAPEPGATNRETVEEHTEDPMTVCATCHATLINPFGFPFEGYDAIGAVRAEDGGKPVNTVSAPLVGMTRTEVDGALALAELLAGDSAVHACYAKHWLQYALGRADQKADGALIDRLSSTSLEDGASVRELIVALVSSRPFLTRSVEEL